MNELWQWVVVVCGAISMLGGAFAVLKKWLKPVIEIHTRLEEVEKHDKNDMQRFEEIDKRFALFEATLTALAQQNEEANQAVYFAIYCMMNHMIDGNHIGKLKEARDALNKHIIEK